LSRPNGGNGEWWVEKSGFPDEAPKKEKQKAARAKLYEVLSHYGYKVKKGVGKQWIQCPFHGDAHASAAVDWSTNFFTCFACDMKGTAIDLVMQKEGCGLDDAVRRIELY